MCGAEEEKEGTAAAIIKGRLNRMQMKSFYLGETELSGLIPLS